MPLRQIADAVRRTDGDQERALMILFEETTSADAHGRPLGSSEAGGPAQAPPTERTDRSDGRRRGDDEEASALQLAQDESLAMALQQQEEEASVRAALRELGVSEAGEAEVKPSEEEEKREDDGDKGEGRDPSSKDDYECQICMEEYPYQHIFVIEACGHGFCGDCMTSYIALKIKERSITAPADPVQADPFDILRPPPEKTKEEPMYGVRCPAFKCTNVLGYPDVQNCVSAELLEEFDTFILNKALEHIPNMTWCPKRCGGGLEVNDESVQFVQCLNPLCRVTFCKRCMHAHKAKLTCDRARERRETKRHTSKPAPMTKAERDSFNKWVRKKEVRHCPSCYVLIEKNLGCDHMHCTRCGRHFAWSAAPTYQATRYFNKKK